MTCKNLNGRVTIDEFERHGYDELGNKEDDLGEKRLNNRLISLPHTLGDNSQASIPVACDTWSETKAAYRLFDNARVNADKILSSHRHTTIKRIKQERTVLVVQDTTTASYEHEC